MIKKLYTGLVLVASVAIISVVITKVFGKKNEDDGEYDEDAPLKCSDCNCK